jgi:hypothetical protein
MKCIFALLLAKINPKRFPLNTVFFILDLPSGVEAEKIKIDAGYRS